MSVDGSLVDLLGLYTLALLVNAAAMLFGTGVAMRLRTMQAGPAMQMPAFLLLFLAPVWVPYDLLTGWVHAAASFNPITLHARDRARLPGRRPDARCCRRSRVALLLVGVTVLWARGGLRSAERAA